MPRTCTLCRHEKRKEIDEALVTGTAPERTIAHQYAVSRDALHRHRAHIPATLTKARQTRETKNASALWAIVERVMEKLETALNNSEVAKDTAALSRELIGAVRMALEGKGELRQGPQVQVNVALASSPEWLSLQAKILAALEPHPAAYEDVRAALRGSRGYRDTAPALPARTVADSDGTAAAVAAGDGAGESSVES